MAHIPAQDNPSLIQSRFLRQNVILFIGTVTLAAINYLYYPVLGRLMSLENFGEVQALLSLFLQAGIFMNALTMVTINVAANYSDAVSRNRVIRELEKLVLYLSFAAGLVALIFVAQLQHFLQFNSPLPFISLILAVILGVPMTLRTAFLHGRQDFIGTSISGIIGAVGKLVFSVVFVVWGWQAFGAITGIIFAEILALIYSAQRARLFGLKYAPQSRWGDRRLDIASIRPELRYGFLVLAVSFITTFLFSGDIVVVKHYFSASEAGLYAGIATIARIIFFATGSIAGVLLPLIRLDQSDGDNYKVLVRSLSLLSAVGGAILLVFAIEPRLVIGTMMGAKYLPYAHLLPRLGLAIFLVSVINLFFFYLLALRRISVAVIAIIGAGIIGILMHQRHETFIMVIDNLLYGSLAILVMLVGWAFLGSTLKKGLGLAHG